MSATRELLDEGQDISLVLAGPCRLDSELREIEALVAAFPDRVSYGCPVDPLEVAGLLSTIDTFLFPSEYRHEAAPLVVVEALAAGARVIASNIGCIKEQVGSHGVVLDDLNALPDALRTEIVSQHHVVSLPRQQLMILPRCSIPCSGKRDGP